jgi:nucleotide-binding universal stress UspA family protein
VPIDFSEGSLAAVRHARELASIFHSHIHLLHVATNPDAPRWALELFSHELGPVQEQHRLEALDRLATLIVAQRMDPFRTTGLVRLGAAPDVIVDYADEIHADLIVMGVHGDHMIPDLAVGEVVDSVLGRVSCPVLTIPEERHSVLRLQTPGRTHEAMAC